MVTQTPGLSPSPGEAFANFKPCEAQTAHKLTNSTQASLLVAQLVSMLRHWSERILSCAIWLTRGPAVADVRAFGILLWSCKVKRLSHGCAPAAPISDCLVLSVKALVPALELSQQVAHTLFALSTGARQSALQPVQERALIWRLSFLYRKYWQMESQLHLAYFMHTVQMSNALVCAAIPNGTSDMDNVNSRFDV